ncbi:hypothetical protein ASG65_05305 [Bacillus sp. Leaf13]|nr:hypothetical protein ASG65_05305 [Bacillus sp. Leaf13]
MKNRKGKLNNNWIPPLTIPEIDFIMEEMNKGKKSESAIDKHHKPNVRIHEKINGASEQIKNIFEDIRKEDNIQLETIEGIKAEIVPIIEVAAKNPDIYYLFEEMQAKNEYTYRHNIGSESLPLI